MASSISTAPGNLRRVRPPTSDSAPPPGAVGPPTKNATVAHTVTATVRRTARQRSFVHPEVWVLARTPQPSFAVTDPYVRRYWTAAIGPGAVADLLRLATAARRGRSLRHPVYLGVLITTGLAAVAGGRLLVRTEVPAVPHRLASGLPPSLRRSHFKELPGA